MILSAAAVAALIGSGIVAGVMFAVALSVVPALTAMPVDRYVYVHRLIGAHWDPTMPVLVLSTTALDACLALSGHGGARWPYWLATGLLLGVSVVSHFCNVPINRRVKAVRPEAVPDDWRDPRPAWRRWHLLRTVLAIAALGVNAAAAG